MNLTQETGAAPDPKTIHQLVKLLASNARPSALRNNSFIVNEVPVEFRIIADENMLATILSRLLYCLVNHGENSCIRVTAKEYDDIIFVQMKSDHGFDNEAIESDLQQAQSYAKKMNGNIGLSKDDDKITGIIFSFPNMDFSKKSVGFAAQNTIQTVSHLF